MCCAETAATEPATAEAAGEPVGRTGETGRVPRRRLPGPTTSTLGIAASRHGAEATTIQERFSETETSAQLCRV